VAPIRILLVEDFEPFRRVVRLLLQARTDLTIVDEAVDGVEAVEKASLLKPDLILMDIGLPKRSGISAAKQIAVDSPRSKLLFVSLEASPETVQAAFQAGAKGYLQKLTVETDLIPAIDAIAAGRQYISGDIQRSNAETVTPRHEALFYSDETTFLEGALPFVRSVLDTGGAAIAIVTASHGTGLIRGLEAGGVDVDRAIKEGRYTPLDVADFLSHAVANGLLDLERLSRFMADPVKSALQARQTEHARVAIVGEGGGQLCAAGNIEGAIDLETKGVGAFDNRAIDFLCPYPMSAFERTDGDVAYRKICAEHTAVLSAST
jgi:DNA-binding NarL/FixJ family response regulator